MAEHRFQTPDPIELVVRIPSGDIDIETVEGDESVVSLDGDEKLVDLTEVRQEGHRIVVELKGKKSFGITISIGDFSFVQSGNAMRVRAKVPHGSSTVVMTASADTEVRGRLASLEAKSTSGDVVVVGEIERDATVKTVSGDVRLDRVGGELTAQTVSGDVSAQSVGGSIESKTVSGDLRVESVRKGRATAQSVSGDIELGVPAGTNLDVDAGSVSGELASEVPLGTDPGAAGDGPLLVVRGKTVSGDFRVFRGQ
jgi:hypothetical protein